MEHLQGVWCVCVCVISGRTPDASSRVCVSLLPLARALVFIAHGAGEHSGPYDELAQRLKELSVLVFAHDHGERAHTYKRFTTGHRCLQLF